LLIVPVQQNSYPGDFRISEWWNEEGAKLNFKWSAYDEIQL
jgi:hypothetical protein